MTYHEAVMGTEVLRHLGPPQEGTVLDGTVGGGGHAWLILRESRGCTVVAVDRDPEALRESERRLAEFSGRVRFVRARFDDAVSAAGIRPGELAGVLLDLGVSSHQLDADERGFAFRRGVVLDMRMNPELPLTAEAILAQSSEEELTDVFVRFGELRRGRRLAREIVRRRDTRPLTSSDDLVAALARALGRAPGQSEKARTFQALRIAVNDELVALGAALPRLRDALRPGAAFVVIAYHSLEDRIVKDAFREWSRACVCPPELPVCVCRGRPLGQVMTRKPERPTPEELTRNPRARSARLRAWRAAA